MNINDDFYTLYNNGDTINENESDNNNNKIIIITAKRMIEDKK